MYMLRWLSLEKIMSKICILIKRLNDLEEFVQGGFPFTKEGDLAEGCSLQLDVKYLKSYVEKIWNEEIGGGDLEDTSNRDKSNSTNLSAGRLSPIESLNAKLSGMAETTISDKEFGELCEEFEIDEGFLIKVRSKRCYVNLALKEYPKELEGQCQLWVFIEQRMREQIQHSGDGKVIQIKVSQGLPNREYTFEHFQSILHRNILTGIWELFAESLLSGEFLSDTEYSDKLKRWLEHINSKLSGGDEQIARIHPLVLLFREPASRLMQACHIMQAQISESQSRIVVASNVDALKGSEYRSYRGIYVTEIFRSVASFLDVANLLIEMTQIDFCAVISEDRLQDLWRLYYLSKRYSTSTSVVFDEGPTISFLSSSAINKAILAKTSVLLYQTYFRAKLIDGDLLGTETHKAKLFSRFEEVKILASDRVFDMMEWSDRASFAELLLSEIKSLERQKSKESSTPPDHVDAYNGYVRRAEKQREAYAEYDKLYNVKFETRASLTKKYFVEKCLIKVEDLRNSENAPNIPLPVLHQWMRDLYKNADTWGLSASEKSSYMGELLRALQIMVGRCKHTEIPYDRRFEWANAHYSVRSGSKVDIFIASYGSRLIDLKYYDDDIFYYYNRIYRGWIVEANQGLIKETAETLYKEADKVEKRFSHNSIALLGIFASIVVFVSGMIPVLKIASDIYEALMLQGALFTLVTLLAHVLYFRGNSSSESDEDKGCCEMIKSFVKFRWCRIHGLPILMELAGLGLFCYGAYHRQGPQGNSDSMVPQEPMRRIEINNNETVHYGDQDKAEKTKKLPVANSPKTPSVYTQ